MSHTGLVVQGVSRRAMGAADRRKWSSLVRQSSAEKVLAQLADANFYGVAIMGPRGVGKTTLARTVEQKLAESTHIIRLFGTDTETPVPYGVFMIQMARLSARQTESQASILAGLADLAKADAKGRQVVISLDDLPAVDTASMGVIMHLLLTRTAKLMVIARHAADLPEDIVWMLKDRLLMENRLEAFSREEVRMLLVKALGGSVAESAVTSLFHTSGGNPLVLHALVHEYRTRSMLNYHENIWFLDQVAAANSDSLLSELVSSRLARESELVNQGVKKMSLLRRVPLAVALPALGADTLSELEERGLIRIALHGKRMVSLVEPYIGETVRSWLSVPEKAALLQEFADTVDVDPSAMNFQELLTFAAWVNDAGMTMAPEVAVAAAQAAVHLFEPKLALDCCAHVPPGHPLEAQAGQRRSRAYFIMANYAKAVSVLESIDSAVLDQLSPVEHAAWASDLVSALLWVRGGYQRVEQVLAEARLQLERAAAEDRETDAARRLLDLARFEFLVHKGEFSEVREELEAGSKDAGDRQYRLNCACLFTLVLAATGREIDAVELSQSIDAEVKRFDLVLRFSDWRLPGLVLARVWSGQWRLCESLLKKSIEGYSSVAQYCGGVLELALGMAYTYAGRGSQAVDVLLMAAAQLELRDTYNCLGLVYSALAFAFAQEQDGESADKYLTMALEADLHTLWVNRSVAEFFQLMAQRWLGNATASKRLIAAAVDDAAEGRFTSASMGLFGATLAGTDEHYKLLEEISLKRQGAMASVNVAVARAHLTKNSAFALEGAAQAESLELNAVEFRCAVIALDLANGEGDARAARQAQKRLDRLIPAVPLFPMLPSAPTVRLTQRELQVARMASRGLGNRAIATRIGVSVRTVEGHLYQVFAKLGISSRDELEQVVEL